MRPIVIVALAAGLAGCGVADTFVNGFKNAGAVASDLEQSLGMRPSVGFQWKNGRLVVVNVTFPHLYEGKPLGDVAEAVRAAVVTEFKQTPDTILLAFTLDKAEARAR